MNRDLPIFEPGTGHGQHAPSQVPPTIAMGGSVASIRRHPDWIKARMPSGENYHEPDELGEGWLYAFDRDGE